MNRLSVLRGANQACLCRRAAVDEDDFSGERFIGIGPLHGLVSSVRLGHQSLHRRHAQGPDEVAVVVNGGSELEGGWGRAKHSVNSFSGRAGAEPSLESIRINTTVMPGRSIGAGDYPPAVRGNDLASTGSPVRCGTNVLSFKPIGR